MVSLDKAIIARLSLEGHHFEILVDPDAALRFRDSGGKGDLDVAKDLAIDTVFKDARKGDQVGEHTLEKVFGTADIGQIARRILQKGEFHLTTEQRRTLLEKKRKAIVALIARNAMNPQTNAPHPPGRIERVFPGPGAYNGEVRARDNAGNPGALRFTVAIGPAGAPAPPAGGGGVVATPPGDPAGNPAPPRLAPRVTGLAVSGGRAVVTVNQRGTAQVTVRSLRGARLGTFRRPVVAGRNRLVAPPALARRLGTRPVRIQVRIVAGGRVSSVVTRRVNAVTLNPQPLPPRVVRR